ncbi:MAG: DUF5320 domain-containing protein [Candidatus Absconditabacteria bacterium]|nr:DUF5320 domain-containing protein [Candidatus Absconditabacteria bacterium]
MPRRDGTGPKGQGPMTGAKMGNCEKNGEKGKNIEFGRGQGNQRCGQKKGQGNRGKKISD